MPCLTYLPPITDEIESIKLLEEAYPTLIRFADVRYPEHRDRALKLKIIDRVMYDGLLKGYAHAGDHVKIAESLNKQMEKLVDVMGISSVEQLKVSALTSIQVCINLRYSRSIFYHFYRPT